MYVLYLYLAACGPKGHGSGLPLPSRTAALFYSPLTRPNPIPNYSELYWGIPVIYTIYPPDKREVVKRTKEKDKGKYILGGPGPSSSLSYTSSPSLSSFTLALPDDTLHPTRVSSRKPTTAPMASSFHSRLKASALGCSHLQAFPTLCHKVLI